MHDVAPGAAAVDSIYTQGHDQGSFTGARAGLVAPDDTTFEYMAGRPHAPKGTDWDRAVADWRTLPSDDDATYAKSITLDASALEPMITYGTNPGMGMSISDRVPHPSDQTDESSRRTLTARLPARRRRGAPSPMRR